MARIVCLFLTLVVALACSKSPEAAAEPVRETIGILYVAEPEMQIRANPDADAPVVTMYKQGETVSIVATKDTWVEVRLASGTGWVPRQALTAESDKGVDETEGASTTVRFKNAPSPVYSQSRTRGEIVLEGNVNTAGIVTNIKTLRNTTGSPDLERQNREEFSRATFYPLLVRGKRAPFIYEYRIAY